MIQTVDGFTYADIDRALRDLGFTVRENERPRVYSRADSEATVAYPPLAMSEPVRNYHYAMARLTVDGFGILSAHDFDLLLSRAAPAETVPA